MSYMHKETFEIFNPLGTIQNPDDDNWNCFYVDDLIAPAVQALNRKGYKTEFCCAGHPFKYTPSEPDTAFDDIDQKYVKIPRKGDSYIAFAEGVFLPELPPGFAADDPRPEKPELCIRKDFSYVESDEKFDIMRKIFNSMEQLYQWALNLPDFKGSEEK